MLVAALVGVGLLFFLLNGKVTGVGFERIPQFGARTSALPLVVCCDACDEAQTCYAGGRLKLPPCLKDDVECEI